ncbi:uncharacterized protein BDV17DRAFT_255142 [Aspergillus undulatus]|uniref:uncharacterized protein n=1 Tax=Aspergillus undulatus TaxID=1810928 RepID=UPI003CCE2BDA
MAYNAVRQIDHGLASDSDSRGSSPRPHVNSSFEKLPLDHENLGAGSHLQRAEEPGSGLRLASMIRRSMTAASYDTVESDEYEVVVPVTDPPASDASPAENRTESETPNTDQSVPLSHPTPGLQSLQGAYLHNVERLEKTAERLSLSSADIGSEIRRMDLEQRRRLSAGSNYFSQDGRSHHDSIQSGTRLAQLSEHDALDEFPQTTTTGPLAHAFLPPPPEPVPLNAIDITQHGQYHPQMNEVDLERPSSAASGDTYRQARILFNDFDGVHYVPMDKGLDLARQLSLTRPPLASRSEPHKNPQEGEDMVFYPAPVPMMLNLPPKLSQRPDKSQREKRRTQLLEAVASDNRKSAAFAADQDQTAGKDRRHTKQPSGLPSQLRASVFFEPPSASLEVDRTQTSAVAALESILDASATAPVTAFTDHPFAGPQGSEVYGKSKHGDLPKETSGKRKSLRPKSALNLSHQHSTPEFRTSSLATHNLYPATEAQAAGTHETASLRRRDSGSNTSSDDDSEESSEGSEDDTGGENDDELEFVAPPATLLAELEQRKHDLKKRRRTAPTAVGLSSTLLQLEAVAAKQSENRRQKPVALAWENPNAHAHDGDDDEDVPLAVLFPEKAQVADDSGARPLGLMERRELEELEPLRARQARLRGEPIPQPLGRRPVTTYTQHPEEHPEDDSDEVEETLAQRLQRLRRENGHERNISRADTDFTTEILAEFDHLKDDENKDEQNEPSPENETLGQRRARLKQEALDKRNSGLKIPRYKRSMADILHHAARPSTAGQQSTMLEAPGPRAQLQHRFSMQHFPVNAGPPMTAGGYSQYTTPNLAGPYGYSAAHPNTFYHDAVMNGGHLSYAMPHSSHPTAMRQPIIDSGQRDVIDRWRQSIV